MNKKVNKMALKYYIQTDIDAYIHFECGRGDDYTLCGLAMDEGDNVAGIISVNQTTKKVNCPSCISVIMFCESIKDSEYIKNK